MANDIRNWAKKQKVGDRNAKVVLLELADCANLDCEMWYSIPTIAETLEMSPKTVERGLAVLSEKKFINRVDRDKSKGKFTSKITKILIPENDWKEILEARKQSEKPTDKLTGGEVEPTDNLSKSSENQQTICPKPTDNLSTGQIDGQYIRDKDVISETLEETEKEKKKLKKKKPSFENFPVPRPDAKPELWSAYLEHRAQIKKPLTPRAYNCILEDLLKVRSDFDLNRRLIDAVDKKWIGLIFDNDKQNGVKNGSNQTTNRNGYEQSKPTAASIIANRPYRRHSG